MLKALSEHNILKLIDYLYQSLLENCSWSFFLEELTKTINCKYVHIFALDKKNQNIKFSNHNFDILPIIEMDFLYDCIFINLKIDLLPKSTYQWCQDEFDLSVESKSTFKIYREFLEPYDLKYCDACKLIDDEKTTVVICFFSTPKQGPLKSRTITFLHKLFPHIARVWNLNIQKFINTTQTLIGYSFISKLRQPVVLSTVKGEILYVNEAGQSLLSSSELITVKDGYLNLPNQYNQRFYDEVSLLEHKLKKNGNTIKNNFLVLNLEQTGINKKIYIFYSVLLSGQVMNSLGCCPVLVSCFYNPTNPTIIDEQILSLTYKLTPAECRITCLLSQGFSQKNIANKLDIKQDTVRKQLQIIYQKTNTNHQTDLVRLIINIPSNFLQNPSFIN